MSESVATSNYIELAADIVSAYVSNNSVPSGDLPSLISDVHGALLRVAGGQVEAPAEAPKPAVAVKKSVTPDYIVCLEDGKKFKSLKRHLRTQYGMTPEQYREKWGLPADYPMVAPNYAKARSELATEMGLGQQRRKGRAAEEGSSTGPRAAAKAVARPAKVTSPAPRRSRKAR
ncbi:MAG TPA: MucR family transcriptional regulator [Microvirga sp.]|nr:MucR family transcriptional regulator [Microvirga sp.]